MAEYVNMYLMGMPKQNRLNIRDLAEVKPKEIGNWWNSEWSQCMPTDDKLLWSNLCFGIMPHQSPVTPFCGKRLINIFSRGQNSENL